jgi:hypothetical protein
MAASYPTSVKSFTTKLASDVIQPGHVNDLQDEVSAIETDLLAGWTAVSFSAGNFTGSGSMTWTVGSGDVIANRYKVIGKTLIWQVELNATTVGGTPSNQLKIAVPTGTLKTGANSFAWIYDNAVATTGYVSNSATLGSNSSSVIGIIRSDQANYTASTNNTYVIFTLIAELN